MRLCQVAFSQGKGHLWHRPDPKQFDYTFDHIASVMNDFTQALGLSHYTLYMQDYEAEVEESEPQLLRTAFSVAK